MASKAARRGLEFEKKIIDAINSKDELGKAIISNIVKNFPCDPSRVRAKKGIARDKPDVIVCCESRRLYLSLKSYSSANYNQIDRNWVSTYIDLWRNKLGCSCYLNKNVEKALYLFVGQVDSQGNPVSVDKLREEAKRNNIKPGVLGGKRRKTTTQLGNMNLLNDLINFLNNCKYKIAKYALIDDYDENLFYFLVIKIDERNKITEFYIADAKSVINRLIQGDVSPHGTTIYLGKIVIQRKGGDRHDEWDDSVANQLQFKVKPSEIVKGLNPIYILKY